jgi:hypothetical protein
VALNRSITLKYMYEIVMTATSDRTYYHKVQDHSLAISNPAFFDSLKITTIVLSLIIIIKIIDFFVGNIFSIFFSCTFKHP